MNLFNRILGLILALAVTAGLTWAEPALAQARLTAGLSLAAKDDATFIPVLVLLKGHQTLAGLKVEGQPQQLKILKNAIYNSQAEVLAAQSGANFRLERRLSLIPAFSARVNKTGLAELAANPNVAVIQANPQLKLATEQGNARLSPLGARATYGGAGVAVAIVDTGIDYTHPALGGGGFPNAKVIGGFDFGDNDADPLDNVSTADKGHGTACAAIAAGDNTAAGDYSGGVAPQAKLYALKIMDSAGNLDLATAYQAWEWALVNKYNDPANPILIISNSWVSSEKFSSFCDSSDPTGAQLLATLTANGISVVAAAGNDGACNGLSSPACLSGTISVGAAYDAPLETPRAYAVGEDSCAGNYEDTYQAFACIDNQIGPDTIACYSNSGPVLDLIAPADCATVPAPGGGYTACFNGTSAATAYAAGAAAVVQSWAKGIATALSPADLKDRLTGHGDCQADAKSGLSRPRINIDQAIASYGGGGCGVSQDAQTVTALETEVSVSSDQDASFVVAVPAGALNLTVTLTGVNGTLDLYTRYGQLPSTTEYNCASTQPDTADETCSHQAPAEGNWYILVRGQSLLAGASGLLKATYTIIPESQGTAKWGVINYACCLNGEAYTFTGTIEGVSKSSITESCSASPTWSGYTTTTAGQKTFSYTRSGCSEEGQGEMSVTLEAGGCYYVALDFQNGHFVQTLYRSEDCSQPTSLTAETEPITSHAEKTGGDGLSTAIP